MAIKANIKTVFGEDRECYIRLNNIEASNHGVKSRALFRGFISQEAFESGSHYVWEAVVEFDADVSQPLWKQAYTALATQENFDFVEV